MTCRPSWRGAVAMLVGTVAIGPVAAACSSSGRSSRPLQIGVPPAPTTSPGTGPRVITRESAPGPTVRTSTRPEPEAAVVLAQPDGHPWPPAIEFRSTVEVPARLVFVLAIGSDARPEEDVRRSRADSVQLLCADPRTGRGTLLGLPRDSYVEIPGHGRGKLNDALARGGPNLVAATVRKLTGLPVDYWVLTGFAGITRMVDELGGIDVPVDRRMNDRFSGARFERGWHHFSGADVLAFARNRHDVANGDFSRSANHGLLLLAALAKARAEIGDGAGIAAWLRILTRYASLDVPVDELPRLATLARRLDPSRLTTVVAPGSVGTAGRQSVVYLSSSAARLFEDLRDDAAVTTSPPRSTSTTTGGPSSRTTTTRPATSTSTSSTSTSSTTSTTVGSIVPSP